MRMNMRPKITIIKEEIVDLKRDLANILEDIKLYQETQETREMLCRWGGGMVEGITPNDITYDQREDIFTLGGEYRVFVLTETDSIAELYWNKLDRWFDRATDDLPDAIRDHIDDQKAKEQLCEDIDELASELDVQIEKFEGKYICEAN
jgi:hypothetical protein